MCRPHGAVKIPVRDVEATLGDYSVTNIAANGISYGSTAYITAVLDKDKYVCEYLDGYEAEAVPDNLVADRLDSAGYQIASALDTDALDTLLNAAAGKDRSGTAYATGDPRHGKAGVTLKPASSSASIDKTNIYQYCVEAAQKLDEADVPRNDGRFIIVTPEAYSLILQDTTNFIRQGDISQTLVEQGAVGSIAGLPVYICNKLTGKNAGSSTGKILALAGHRDWCTEIEAWKVAPGLYDLNGDANVVGGSAVKCRKVYTHEVTKPQTLVRICQYFA